MAIRIGAWEIGGDVPAIDYSGAVMISPTYGSMSPIGASVGNIYIGATEIAGTTMGGWPTWEAAGMMNPSFAYGSPTSLAGIALGGIQIGATEIGKTVIGRLPRRRLRRHEPRQLWDVFTGRDRRF